MVVFARHDLTRHAPFTRMDMVSCRNLLIYVRPRYQEHILRALHFALVRGGHLILGLAESLGSLTSEFVTVQREFQIYRKLRDVRLVTRPLLAAEPPGHSRTVAIVDRRLEDLPAAVIGAWLRQHDGCALVLNQQNELAATYGDVTGALVFPDGRVNARAPDLLAPHLEVAVMTAVRRTRAHGEIVRLGRIATPGGKKEPIEVTTVPLLGDGMALGTVAVFIGRGDEALTGEVATLTGGELDTAAARRIHELENELARSLEDQRATIEELEAANEEQQSTNEEVLAANEELQSVNEELQSVNEELQTVNAEFRAKLNEVTELNADLDNLLQSTDIAVIFVDESLRIRKYTPAAETMINLVPRDLGRLLTDISHHLLDVDLGKVLRQERQEPRVVHSQDGRSMELRVRPYMRNGRVRGRVLTLYDITVGQETERALTRSRRMLRQALDLLPQEVSVIDAAGRLLLVNRAFASYLDAGVDELEDSRLPGLDAGQVEAAKLMREVTKVLEAGRPLFVSAEDSVDKQGRPRILQTTRLPLGLDTVERPAVLSVSSDITHVRIAEETVRRQSMYDPLTKLPNRLLFSERVQHAVARLARRESRWAAVLFLDLDRFKEVNDTEGHLAGDQLLLEFAGRLQEALRPGDTVSRFGGDEFAVLLEDVGGLTEVQHVCARLHTQLAVPFDVGDAKHLLSASIGVRLISSPEADVNDILRDADTAMYAAKNGGRGRSTIFSEALAEENNEAVRLRQSMLAGMAQGEFEPWYQPVVRLADGRMKGVESLMRWRRGGEVVAPAGFLEQAINGGVLADLESLLWPRIASDIVAWRDGIGSLPPSFYVSINVSAESLGTADFAPRFLDVFRSAGVDPALIAVELTEHSLHARTRIVREHLEALREAGVRVQLDDFGTGHASLTNLVQFPLDVIKIDRSFVRAHDRARKLAKAAIGIAQDLDLQVIAEGVETQESRTFLLGEGVELAQGFLFARPQPAAELVELLARTHLDGEREREAQSEPFEPPAQ